MSSATLHLHVPIEYELPDGTKFTATKIDVLDYAQELPDKGSIRVYGTAHMREGPRAHQLVIPLKAPVDLETDLRERVRVALSAGDYKVR